MRVSSIRNSYYNPLSRKKLSSPNFKATILSQPEINRVLKMLKPAVTETIVSSDINIFKKISNILFRKYLPKGIDSYGIMVIPDKNLMEFCKNIKMPNVNLNSMKGYCISAGGKYSPMQIWTEVYESKLVLIPQAVFPHKK